MEEEIWTIEPSVHGGFWVCKHGFYDRTSVLEGYPFRQLHRWFPTLEAALQYAPKAEVLDHEWRENYDIPHHPPEWFDEADAGERWDDDY